MPLTRKQKRILVVDDASELLEIYQELLGTNGYEVIQAESGDEAIQTLSKTPVDVIITDLQMPNGNGLKVCGWASHHGVPVIVVTGHTLNYQPFLGGVAAVIEKPVSFEDLLAKIDTCVNRGAKPINR
jgi:two-component system OmpR family response regulator